MCIRDRRRCSLGGDGYAAVLLGRYKVGSQLRLVTVNSDEMCIRDSSKAALDAGTGLLYNKLI